jgi:hypothetical protein
MFEGANAIDWTKLSHSHGTCEQVPARLRMLLANSKQERSAALEYFWEYMLHQGSRYEASPHVVPFLFEALEAPKCVIERELIDILLALAVGYGESFLPGGYNLDEEERRFQEKSWRGLFSYEEERRAYYAVHDRAEAFIRYLHPTFPSETRLSAAFAVAHFAQPLNAVHKQVAGHIRDETDDRLLQCLLLCFGLLCRYAGDAADLTIAHSYLSTSHSQALRLVAAVALTTALGPQTPTEAYQTLLTALTESWQVQSARGRWQWWNEGDLLGHAALTLKLVDKDRRNEIAHALCAALTKTEACTFALPNTLLDVLFPEPPPAGGWKASGFDDVQRTSLTILLRTRHWTDWMISQKFLPRGLTGNIYRSTLDGFIQEVTGQAKAPDSTEVGLRAGNVSSWTLKEHWP